MPTGRAHGRRTLPHSDVQWIELRLHKLVNITYLVRAIYDGCGIFLQRVGTGLRKHLLPGKSNFQIWKVVGITAFVLPPLPRTFHITAN